MLINSNEQGFVRVSTPPVDWNIIVVSIRNPDFQLTVPPEPFRDTREAEGVSDGGGDRGQERQRVEMERRQR